MKIFLKTFGCQMNDRDSEEITGILLEKGYSIAGSPEEADVVIFNTCAVRKHAEDRAISNIGALKTLKKKRPQMIIGVVGCMAKAQGDKIIQKLPLVDFIAAPANIYQIPEIIDEIAANMTSRRGQVCIDRENRPYIKNIAYHTKGVSALVTIMEGCNNFCSYCIVPYVRGGEVGRPEADIIDEVKGLAEKGYKEVTLLGQNVNSYRQSSSGVSPSDTSPFVNLLEKINEINGIERIRFLTSHPKDAGEDLFKAMRDLPKVCEHLHLPLQSGSDRILRSMNRDYTAEAYLKKVDSLRRYLPDCAITTDIIVGYPGETQEDFKATESLIERIGFNFAFIFKYSPRPPARASKLENDVPDKMKEERNHILLELQDKISAKKEKEFIGKDTEVLLEAKCRKEDGKLMGRNRQNIKVAFAGKGGLIGDLLKIKIKSVFGHTLVGSAVLFMLLSAGAFCDTVRAETLDEYFVRGDYETVVREGVKSPGRSKEKDRAYYMIGTSLNKLGRYDLARKNFETLIDTFPRSGYSPLAQLGIADSYYLSSDYKNAKTEYEKYMTKYPKSEGVATAYFRLAKCAQKDGEWQAARNYYQKVKSEYPLSFEAQLSSQALNDEILFFTVQVGSFNKKANALKLCDELVKKDYQASIAKSQSETEESYKVRVGKLNSRQEAEELAKKLRAEGLPTKVLP